MATLTVQTLDEDGIIRDSGSDIFVAAADLGDQYAFSETTMVCIENSGSASVAVTIAAQVTPQRIKGVGLDVTIPDIVLTIDASSTEISAWAFPPSAYADASGMVQLTYSAHEDLKVAAFKVAKI